MITNVRLEDDNTVYTCTATNSGITSSVMLNVIGKFYEYLYVCTMQITLGQTLSVSKLYLKQNTLCRCKIVQGQSEGAIID